MKQPAESIYSSLFPRAADPARHVGPSRTGESTATLHILPLHARREPAVQEWTLVRQRLGQIATLSPQWNGGAGIAPDLQTIAFAGQQLAGLQQQGVPAPTINPSPDGAIYAEWHTRGLDIELIFEAPYRVIVLAEDVRNEIPVIEGEGSDISIAYNALKVLCAR
jgi:hypothetical protein